jgi:organic hydroperoxide reductase OsmC/OhrA
MQISATVINRPGRNDVVVRTGDNLQELAIEAKSTGGSAVNGGEFLMLALATCYCNDLYREAARLGIALEAVQVDAHGAFEGVGLAATDVHYDARITSTASKADIERLLRETDAVAEVHNTLRRGTPVTLELSGGSPPWGKVTAEQLEELRGILQRYPTSPLRDKKWRDAATDDDVWLRIVSQVVVVGAARPADGLQRQDIREGLSWARLSKAPDEDARQAIWHALRDIGARYAGKQAEDCRKTAAILNNLRALAQHSGGPRGFLRALEAQDSTEAMIKYVTRHLSYVRNKGARDLLTSGFGLATDRIALDSRVLGALRHLGIDVPEKAPADPEEYAALERWLLQEVCAPIGDLRRATGPTAIPQLRLHQAK